MRPTINVLHVICDVLKYFGDGSFSLKTCHSRKSTDVNNKINDGWIPFSCFDFIVHAGSLSHCHGLLGHLNRTEPLLMLLVTPAFLLWQVKMFLSIVTVRIMFFTIANTGRVLRTNLCNQKNTLQALQYSVSKKPAKISSHVLISISLSLSLSQHHPPQSMQHSAFPGHTMLLLWVNFPSNLKQKQ